MKGCGFMEWNKLSDDSIRIILTKGEVSELGLVSAYDGVLYRSEIEKLLEIKCNESGFVLSGSKALVQVFSKMNGSLEIVITKLDDQDIVKSNTDKGKNLYFIFNDADALIDGCLRIKPVESNLYYTQTGEFVISIPYEKCTSDINDILSEYVIDIEDEDFEQDLTFVVKNAIGKIQEAFNKK